MTRWITIMGAAAMQKVGGLGRTGMFLGQTLLDCLTPMRSAYYQSRAEAVEKARAKKSDGSFASTPLARGDD